MARKKKKQQPMQEPVDLVDSVRELIKRCNQSIESIMQDYLADEELYDEVQEVIDGLSLELQYLLQKNQFETAIDLLHMTPEYERDTARLLMYCDEDETFNSLKQKGFAFVKIETEQQRERLLEFVETKIWPHYNQQVSNVLI